MGNTPRYLSLSKCHDVNGRDLSNAPLTYERIWLQADIGDGATWCQHRQEDEDVPYVREDFYEDLTSQLAEARAEIERLRGVLRKRTEEADDADCRAEKAEAELAALKGAMVKPLEFAETNNRPPTYDTGITKLGRWRVTYSDDEWKVIWGHSAIIARCNTMADAFAAAQADYTARILSALASPPEEHE